MSAKLATNDLEAFWMPFTANRQYKRAPRLFVRAERMHYTTDDGRRVLDGTSGLWCVNAGHCRPKIVEAIRQQAGELDFAGTFQMGHPRAFECASKLVNTAPPGFDHVFFTNSGLNRSRPRSRSRSPIIGPKATPRRRDSSAASAVITASISVAPRLVASPTTANGSVRCSPVSTISATLTIWPATPSAGVDPSMAPSLPTISSASSRCTMPRPSPR